MYYFSYSAAIFLASVILSHARHTVLTSSKEEHSYLPSSSESDICTTPQCVIEASNILTSLDEAVDPCDDFYRFACGGWFERIEDPTDEELSKSVFDEAIENLYIRLKDLLESENKISDPPFVKMLKNFYNSCVDMDLIEKQGSEHLKKKLRRFGGWPVLEGDKWEESSFDWLDTLISFREHGLNHDNLLRLLVENESVIRIHSPHDFVPDGSDLALGLNDDKIAEYFKIIKKAAKLLGADENAAEKELQEVVLFLIALKNSTMITEEVEEESNETADAEVKYHTVKELQDEVSKIPWLKYFKGILNVEVYENDTVHVGKNIYFLKNLADLLESTDKRVIANYMMMRAVLESAEYLSEEWNSIHEEGRKLFRSELKIKPNRWKKCIKQLAEGLDVPLASYYVRHYFNDGSKDEAMILVKYIQQAFIRILEENDWMDEKTREKAEAKAKALKSYIGFPEELLDDTFMMKICGNITMSPDSYFKNAATIQTLIAEKRYSKYRKSGKKKDHRFENLVKVNAYYNPEENSMEIPAGILHDAFYEKERPNYMNFGAVGYIIGHEITHGFDNDGRHFDKDGNKTNWWDKESDEHFRKKAYCIVNQYNEYTTYTGLKVNGEYTQAENIADNGGLKEAYWGYQAWTKDHGIEPRLPGLNYTQNQLFWLSAGHAWCEKTSPEGIRLKIVWDSHSPERFRIIGPMSNMEEFSKDFNCPPDAPMNRKYKCKVW